MMSSQVYNSDELAKHAKIIFPSLGAFGGLGVLGG